MFIVFLVYRFSPSTNTKVPLSPWVCHFHISEVQTHTHIEPYTSIYEQILMNLFFNFTESTEAETTQRRIRGFFIKRAVQEQEQRTEA